MIKECEGLSSIGALALPISNSDLLKPDLNHSVKVIVRAGSETKCLIRLG